MRGCATGGKRALNVGHEGRSLLLLLLLPVVGRRCDHAGRKATNS